MGKNYLKQFTEWVIGSRPSIFLWARIKLTLLYVTFIAVILFVFSVGLYVNIDKNVQDNVSDKIKEKVIRQEFILHVESQLQNIFIIGDLILLAIVGGLVFFAAGENLRPIQRAMEKQKRFTADASHDLRTPLAIMKTDCEINLKKNESSVGEWRELAKSNLEEVNRMSMMVDQLLFLSRNNEMVKQQRELISLGKLVEKIVVSFKNLAESKKIELHSLEMADGQIKGNQLDLERAIANILKNAINYTSENGKIEVAVKKNKRKMEILVKDNGIGIAEEDLAHITEAFYKADKVRGQENGGSGLGLSIVEEIVKSHHGKLNIDSKLGIGTEVAIIFPI